MKHASLRAHMGHGALTVVVAGIFSAGATFGASTGATYQSGVGDAYFEHPTYAAGASIDGLSIRASTIGFLPIAFEDRVSHPSIFDPRYGDGREVNALRADMNMWLDSATERLGLGVRLSFDQNVQYTLILTLEVGSYRPYQRGVLSKKEVELGTKHTAS